VDFGGSSMTTARSSPIRALLLVVDRPNRAEVSGCARRHVLDLPAAAGIGVPVVRSPERRASLAVAPLGLAPPLAATRHALG
jgi:hypothetical protein